MQGEIKTTTGIIGSKQKNESTNPKAPYGFVYLEGSDNKYTVWKEVVFSDIKKGGHYELGYAESENEYNGKTYTNYMLTSARDIAIELDKDKITFSPEETEELEKVGVPAKDIPQGDGTGGYSILGRTIIEDDSVDTIRMPKEVFLYIMALQSQALNSEDFEDG